MRTFAIGDIHGCAYALQTLLESLQITSEDRLIFLGDYVDRGPDSRGVLETLIELSHNPGHVFLRGNHEDMMLQSRFERKMLKSWLACGGRQTLQSYGAQTFGEIPLAHLQFLEETHFCFESYDHIFAHAAVGPEPLEENEPGWLMWGSLGAVGEHPSGKRIVLGHTAQQSGLPLDKGFLVGIDTYCHGGGWLTALDVDNDRVFQANELGKTREFGLGEVR